MLVWSSSGGVEAELTWVAGPKLLLLCVETILVYGSPSTVHFVEAKKMVSFPFLVTLCPASHVWMLPYTK